MPVRELELWRKAVVVVAVILLFVMLWASGFSLYGDRPPPQR